MISLAQKKDALDKLKIDNEKTINEKKENQKKLAEEIKKLENERNEKIASLSATPLIVTGKPKIGRAHV